MNLLCAASGVLAMAAVAGPTIADDDHDPSPLAILREATAAAQQAPRPARDVLLKEIVADLAAAGQLDEAARTAESIEHSGSKDQALCSISVAKAKAGHIPDALRTARAIGGEFDKNQATAIIAMLQAEAGDVPGAVRTANSLGESAESPRGEALIRIAETQAKSGDIRGAIETTRTGLTGWRRDLALSAIAQVQDTAGDLAGAMRTTESTCDRMSRVRLLSLTVRSLLKAGDIERAIRTVDQGQWLAPSADPPLGSVGIPPSMASDAVRDDALAGIVAAQARAGDTPGLCRTADAIHSRDAMVRALADAAVTRLEAKDRAGAESILAKASNIAADGEGHASQWRDIAYVQAKLGDIPAARRTFLLALTAGGPVANQRLATQRQLRAGDKEGALQTARAIVPASVRALALADIAEDQARAGDLAGSAETFRRAVEDPSQVGCESLREVARAQARTGNAKDALVRTDALTTAHHKACSLLGTAEGLMLRRPSQPGQ